LLQAFSVHSSSKVHSAHACNTNLSRGKKNPPKNKNTKFQNSKIQNPQRSEPEKNMNLYNTSTSLFASPKKETPKFQGSELEGKHTHTHTQIGTLAQLIPTNLLEECIQL
jgi:hypothetical protein